MPASAVGYVDFAHAALLAGPAVLSARASVWAAHYINALALRWSFAVVAFAVAGADALRRRDGAVALRNGRRWRGSRRTAPHSSTMILPRTFPSPVSAS